MSIKNLVTIAPFAIALLAASPALAQNAKISTLIPVTTPLTGSELFYVVQGGVSKNMTFSALQASLGVGLVASVSNSDGTLTISSPTGAVAASLALGHANTWTGVQTLNSPVLVTPALGTPASGVLTNLTGLPVSTGLTGLGTNVATALSAVINASTGLPNVDGSIATGNCLKWGPGVQDAGAACSNTITDSSTVYSGGTSFGVIYDNSGVVSTTATGILGQALTSNGAAAPTYKTGARTLLNTLTASNSATLQDTTSFTSSYSEYDIVFENLVSATATVACEIQVNSGGFQAISYVGEIIAGISTTVAASVGPTTYISCGTASVLNAAPGVSGSFHLSNPSGTSAPKNWFGIWGYPAASSFVVGSSSSYWNGNGAITGFQMLFSSGNITSGAIKIYGYN